MPFLQLAISQMARSQDFSAIGESSKMVPTLTENCRLRVLGTALKPTLFRQLTRLWYGRMYGHETTPSGQRICDQIGMAEVGVGKELDGRLERFGGGELGRSMTRSIAERLLLSQVCYYTFHVEHCGILSSARLKRRY